MTRVSVLQLDTRFPRVPGDIAATQTYTVAPEILRVSGARVAQVVTSDPGAVDIAPFVDAARRAKGDVLTTSCGFLAPFEKLLSKAVDRPFLASSLNALPELFGRDPHRAIQVMTFDADRLNAAHLPADIRERLSGIVGLRKGAHLRSVIANDLTTLDQPRAQAQITAHLKSDLKGACDLLVLECTNLPPYKAALQRTIGAPTFDILDRIETASPGTIRPQFLSRRHFNHA